jgi:hypothetical protein
MWTKCWPRASVTRRRVLPVGEQGDGVFGALWAVERRRVGNACGSLRFRGFGGCVGTRACSGPQHPVADTSHGKTNKDQTLDTCQQMPIYAWHE